MKIYCLNDKSLDGNFGDCTAVVSDDGHALVIDTTSSRDKHKYIIGKLKKYGVTKFDLLISHPHFDHITQAVSFMNNFEVTRLYVPSFKHLENYLCNPTFKSSKNKQTKEAYSYLLQQKSQLKAVTDKAHEKNIPVSFLYRGMVFYEGDVRVEVIWKNDSIKIYSDKWNRETFHGYMNNSSAVCMIEGNGVKYFTGGDIFKSQEREMLNFYPKSKFKADIMKLSHHGGNSSNSEDLVKAVSPTYAWFNYDEGGDWCFNRNGWVKRVISTCHNSGASVLGTHYNGDIVFTCIDGKVFVKAEFHTKSLPNASEYNMASRKPNYLKGYTDEQLACQVITGVYGAGDTRKQNLGNRYDGTQEYVNKMLSDRGYLIRSLADYVLCGLAGKGNDRKVFLGKYYDDVQAKVNFVVQSAQDVWDGKYGKMEERQKKLGDDFDVVQRQVNRTASSHK